MLKISRFKQKVSLIRSPPRFFRRSMAASSSHEPNVVENLAKVKEKIELSKKQHSITKPVRLVAVSKTKPSSLISDCYEFGGQRHFGENYVNELIDKAKILPQDIHWHFIGHLQSNKAKQICQIPNLWMVETVDSTKLADELNKRWTLRPQPLNVLVQVNTSQETSKSGCEANELSSIVKHIQNDCPNLKFCGLMTIGLPDSPPEKPDWKILKECKEKLLKEIKFEGEFEMSFGMSNDFEEAISWGATNVRIGSTIFGHREYPTK